MPHERILLRDTTVLLVAGQSDRACDILEGSMGVMERSTSSVGTIKVRATSAPIFHSSNISDSILD